MSEYSDMTAGYRNPKPKSDAVADLFKNAKPCPARRWEGMCPYPSVCRDKQQCVDGCESSERKL